MCARVQCDATPPVNLSTCPDALSTTSGVTLVHSISSMFSSMIKCCLQNCTTFDLTAQPGGP